MRKIWITTDTHFRHNKMVEYCSRPYNFSDLILKGFKPINEEDILIHLGDICMGHDLVVHQVLSLTLKCTRILIKGNHDGKSNNWYLDHGWDFICETLTDNYFGKNILFSHHPIPDNGYDLNIHGHCHTSKRLIEYEKEINDKQILIALEKVNYKPLLLKNIIEDYVKNTNKTTEG